MTQPSLPVLFLSDLVVLPADPREDLGALGHPLAVVLRGRLVAPPPG